MTTCIWYKKIRKGSRKLQKSVGLGPVRDSQLCSCVIRNRAQMQIALGQRDLHGDVRGRDRGGDVGSDLQHHIRSDLERRKERDEKN